MESQPLVSILINNYNYGRFLKEAIESALNQTYPRIEVIVVDDGSTDNSREVISSYGDRIVSILKENGGQASAFNAGFAASQGDVVCFLDADDLFKPEKAATVVLDFQKAQEIGWHFHTLEFFGIIAKKETQEVNLNPSELSGIYDLRPYLKKGKLKGRLSFEIGTATSGICFRRSFLEKVLPMSEEIRITSDDYIKYAALGSSEGFISFQTLAKQRIHGDNAYTFKPNNGRLRATTQLLTAYKLKENFPSLSKFANNLAVIGISAYWLLEGDKITLRKLIQSYLGSTTLLEKFTIYTKAIYYRFIHFRLVNLGLKR
ncbi:MAG TPA: glycosyltransferase [Coleofasciculaceae cyanobacterium]|jgi:glycosyltransferase involved in cell wall biosynthesis